MRQFKQHTGRNLIIFVCSIQGIYGKSGGGIIEPQSTEPPTPSPLFSSNNQVPSPSPTSSPEPTVFEVFSPSPNSEECRSTTNGVFGQLEGEPLVVSFNYAVELADGTSESEFTSLFLPDLEISMNDAIIPTLFLECSATTTTVTRRRLLSSVTSHRQLLETIVGISTRPIDSIDDDIECASNNCYGIFGTVTIFLQEESTTRRRRVLQETESHATMVRQAIKAQMDLGTFNNIAESILNVTWVDDGFDGSEVENPPIEVDDDDISSTDRSRNGETIGWTVAAGAAAFFMVIAAVTVQRRRRRNNTDDQSAIEGNSTINSAI